jgi:hypothetical protein
MVGREEKMDNDMFFSCSLIDYIARKTKNERKVVINAIGKEKLLHIYELADVYHSENIDKISDELIEDYNIKIGDFDNVKDCKYNVPTHWDIGKVYKRLIIELCKTNGKEPINALIEVYNSWISDKIDNYNSSMYYENPSYIYYSYLEGQLF